MNTIIAHCSLMHDMLALYYLGVAVFFSVLAILWRYVRSLLETRVADVAGIVLFLGCVLLAYIIL